MPSTIPPTSDADSSSDILVSTDERYLDVDHKQSLLADYLNRHGYTAVIIQQPWNFQWFTSGGSNHTPNGSRCASLYVSSDSRVLLTTNADSAWMFDTQVPQLGFYAKERDWTQSVDLLVSELSRGRRVVSDSGVNDTKNIDEELQSLRLTLTPREQWLARKLGEDLTRCVERVALKFQPGQTELDVAGILSHRLMALGIEPMGLRVKGDGRSYRYRQCGPRPVRMQNFCTVGATGRRDGVCLSVSRTISHSPPSQALQDSYQAASICQATGQQFSQHDWSLEEIWGRVRRSYEKFGFPDEWREGEQGEVLAHRPCEHRIVPHSALRLEPGMLINWRPQVQQATLSDTVLVTADGTPDWLTKSEHWPVHQIEVRGKKISQPDLVTF